MERNETKTVELINTIKRLGLTPKEAIAILAVEEAKNGTSFKLEITPDAKQEIFQIVKSFLENEGYEVMWDTPISDFDIFEVVELIIHIEEKYHNSIVIKDTAADKWGTVNDLVDTVFELLQER